MLQLQNVSYYAPDGDEKEILKNVSLEIKDKFTVITGPNGSGKSNIADAVRWVLGEQSAKALRGEKMEDVIFNGTEAKKPLSYGEVSLTFDNYDHELATDFNEVCVTRRIYRSGESEYFINRSSCRRKDIAELFRDTGVGREGYSIIGQGRELEERVGPLEEQSAAAREYLKLRDELKEIEINVFLYQYDRLNERINTLNEAIESIGEEQKQKEEIEAAIAANCAQEEELERALNTSISQVQAELLKMTTGVEGHAGESKVLSERMEAFMREKEQRQNQLDNNEKRYDELAGQIDESRRKAEESEAELSAKRTEAAQAAEELNQLSTQAEKKEESLEEQKAALIDAMNRIADARILISRFETMRQGLVAQAENMARNRARAEEKRTELKP